MSDETELLRQTHAATVRLRGDLTRWLDQSSLMDGPYRNRGGEDEANYALAWFPHYLVTGEEAILTRFRSLRDDLLTWVRTDCHHGYEAEAEAHHGTEPFLLFLPRYLGLCPDDDEARDALEDAAHHIGNWVDDVPPWYDETRDVFMGYQIGSRVVGGDEHQAVELGEHYRFIHIALAAHRLFGDTQPRYLDWALRYGRARAQRLLETDDPVPLAWDHEGHPIRWEQARDWPGMGNMGGLSHKVDGDPLGGIENHLASGAVQALADLYEASGDAIFHDAARRLIEPLIDLIDDRFGDVMAAAISHYRLAFDDGRFDERLLAAIDRFPPASDGPQALMLPEFARRREPAPGKRSDMLYWGEWEEDGSATPSIQPSTAALTLAFEVTGDVTYAQRALDLSSRRFGMARRVLRSGREHADMGGAICSVAAGHGRNWGVGAVTGCYGPLLLGARDAFGEVRPAVRFSASDAAGLPEAVLSLVRQPVGAPGELLLFNGGDASTTLEWTCAGKTTTTELSPGQTQRVTLPLQDNRT